MGKPSIEVAVMAESTAVKRFLVGKLFLPLGISFELLVYVLNEIGRVDAGSDLLGILVEGKQTLSVCELLNDLRIVLSVLGPERFQGRSSTFFVICSIDQLQVGQDSLAVSGPDILHNRAADMNPAALVVGIWINLLTSITEACQPVGNEQENLFNPSCCGQAFFCNTSG